MTGARVWWVIFVTVLVTHIPFLTVPAGIDSTWSVMAGAQTLAETRFNYPELIRMKGFLYGGPSTHATSIVTLGTAIVLWVLGAGTPFLITMHVIHLAIGASGLWFYLSVSKQLLPPAWSIGSTIAIGLTPLVFTQFGMMYLETPLFTMTMGSLWFFSRDGRFGSASLSLLAPAIKASGLAIAVTQALVTILSGRKSLRRSLPVLIGATAVVVAVGSVSDLPTGSFLGWRAAFRFWTSDWSFLAVTPLTLGLFIAYLVAAKKIWRSNLDRSPLVYWVTLFPIVFIGGHVVGPLLGQPVNLLPRYWIVAIPAMILTVSLWLASEESALPGPATGAAYLVAATLGLFGFLLPGADKADFILAERAPSSVYLLLLERDAISILQDSDATVLVTRDTAYRMTIPAAGFVTAVDTDFKTVVSSLPITDVPDHVIFLQRHFGPAANTIEVEQLGDEWDWELTPLRRGPFLITVVEAHRRPSPVAAP